MIEQILQLLKISDFYGVSTNVDIAKGINAIPKTYKATFKQGYREIKAKK